MCCTSTWPVNKQVLALTLFVRNSSYHVYYDCSMKQQPISTAVVLEFRELLKWITKIDFRCTFINCCTTEALLSNHIRSPLPRPLLEADTKLGLIWYLWLCGVTHNKCVNFLNRLWWVPNSIPFSLETFNAGFMIAINTCGFVDFNILVFYLMGFFMYKWI